MNNKEYDEICHVLWSNNQEFHEATRDKQIAMLTAWSINVAGLCAHYGHDISEVMEIIPTIYEETLEAVNKDRDPLNRTIN